MVVVSRQQARGGFWWLFLLFGICIWDTEASPFTTKTNDADIREYDNFLEEISTTLTTPTQSTTLLYGLRVEVSPKPVSYDDDSTSIILADKPALIRIFGNGITQNTMIKFVTQNASRGSNCGMKLVRYIIFFIFLGFG